MVPLKYGELQSIKNFMFEAVKVGRQFGWDEDVQMKAMIREEHTLTVYFSLRKREDNNKRYYDNLEDVAKEVESTVEELYRLYTSNFVLTEQERGNS